MSKQTKIIIIALAVVSIISVAIFISSQNTGSKTASNTNYGSVKTTQIEVPLTSQSNSQQTTQPTSKTESKDEVGKTDSNQTKNIVNLESGYTLYNQDKLANAKNGKVVLFFHANWCPSCKALDTNIKDNIKNIPNNLLILKVDYDSSNSLKQKYGITSQHTLVQVNENGDLIKSSKGLYQLNTLESIIQTF